LKRLGLVAALLGHSLCAAAADSKAIPLSFSVDMQSVLAYTYEELIDDSLFNPGNAVAQRPSAQLGLELRPDLQLSSGRLSLTARPRVRVSELFGADSPAEAASANDAYINTWKLKAALTSTVSVSYGREVLQWGNGTFRSPSNPFFIDTGKLNPITELYGKDFFSLAYTPSPTLSFTFIENVGAGRREPSAVPFERITALKLDYVGDKASAGLIASKQRSRTLRAGGYLTYTASDAMLLYAESTLAHGSDAFFPQRDTSALGGTLEQSARDSGHLFYSHLVGAAYSLESGTTLTLEYLHSNEGYDSQQARDFRSLGRQARAQLMAGGPEAAKAGELLGRGLDPNLRLLRQDYLFFQVFMAEYLGKADIALRYSHTIDDKGAGLSTSIIYSAGQRAQFFFIGSYNRGGRDTQFARLHQYTLFAGLRYFPF
jgi:hypothetical protein